ncbi:MAG TPA: outer membrane beta-barrel protein [Flavipsychrobacter sp.]|nr:outer membrane beta-barrel protein [Flavipsychrobacter sp.]
MNKALYFLSVLFYFKSYAQKASISVFAGGGVSYVKSKGQPISFNADYPKETSSKFFPVVTPHFDVRFNKPVSHGTGIETGVGYARRGYRQVFVDKTIYPNQTFHRYENNTRTSIDYIRIPVTVTYQHQVSRNASLSLATGMDYGFAFTARQKGHFTNSYSSGEVTIQEYDRKPDIKLLAGENRFASYNAYWADFFLFDVALSFNIQFRYKKKFLLRVLQSYSLYAHQPQETSDFKTRLRYTGLSVGYSLWR